MPVQMHKNAVTVHMKCGSVFGWRSNSQLGSCENNISGQLGIRVPGKFEFALITPNEMVAPSLSFSG